MNKNVQNCIDIRKYTVFKLIWAGWIILLGKKWAIFYNQWVVWIIENRGNRKNLRKGFKSDGLMLCLFISDLKPFKTPKDRGRYHVFSLGYKIKTLFPRWRIDQSSEDFWILVSREFERRRDCWLMRERRSVIGWRTRYLIGWERHLAIISLQALLSDDGNNLNRRRR